MKSLVIGSSVGIGAAIKEALISDGVGSTTGFDIMETNSDFDFTDYDIVVLNAYAYFTDQLNTVYNIVENKTWTKDKLLMVIASTSAYKTNPSDMYWAKYYTEKAAVIHACRELNTMGFNTSVISPGTVDTHRNENKDIPKIPAETLGEIALDIAERYLNNGVLVEHIVVRTKK